MCNLLSFRILLLGFVFFTLEFGGYAQSVGILTATPDKSAALDVDVNALPANNKKGLLFPHVKLTGKKDRTTVLNPATGLVVYNTVDSGSGEDAVEREMLYFWDGQKWLDMTNMDIVIRELFPQMFFVLENDAQVIGASSPSTTPVLVTFSSNPTLNTGNNIHLDKMSSQFLVLNTGRYEISGLVGYNPDLGLERTTNLEFIIQISRDRGNGWKNIARTVSMWGKNTTRNSRHLIISPMVVSLSKGDRLRAVVMKTQGENPGVKAQLNPAGGVSNSKILKIQRLD